MAQGGRAGNALRQFIAPRLHLFPGLRDRIIDGETPPLHRSALVRRPFLRRSLAGRLCPNVPLGDGHRLDDLATAGFLLITTTEPAHDLRQRLVERGTHVLVVDRASELGAWLSDGRSVAALVRPDRTVMQAGQDLAALGLAAPLSFRPQVWEREPIQGPRLSPLDAAAVS